MNDSPNRIDRSISEYVNDRHPKRFVDMYKAILEEVVLVPVRGDVRQGPTGEMDIPVVCIRSQDGQVQMPVFSSLDHLHVWKLEGSAHIELVGRMAIQLACDIQSVDEIVINVAGTPTGRIPRVDFRRMLDL